jgi:hypothetical protein
MFPYKSLPFPEKVDKGLRTERLVGWSVGQFFSRLYWGLYVEVRIVKNSIFIKE